MLLNNLLSVFQSIDPRYVIFGRDDVYANIWFLWHTHMLMTLGKFQDIFFTRLLFYPFGSSIAMNIHLVHMIISYPFGLIFGPIAAYNMLVIFTFIGTFCGMFLFLRLISGSSIPSSLGAAWFTFTYYRLKRIEAGHLNLLGTEWIGFLLYMFWMHFHKTRNLTNLLLLSVFFSLHAYTDLQTFLMISLWMLFGLFIEGIRFYRKGDFYTFIKDIGIFVLTSFVLLSPILYLHRGQLLLMYIPSVLENKHLISISSADLLSFFIFFPKGRNAFIGFIPFFLIALYGILSKKTKEDIKIVIFFLLISVPFVLLSFGPLATVNFMPLPFSEILPYHILTHLPGFKLFHEPYRFVLLVQITVSVLLVLVFRWINESIKSRLLCSVCQLMLLILMVWPTITMLSVQRHYLSDNGLVRYISAGPEGSVLAIPFNYADSFSLVSTIENQEAMVLQTIHGKPLMGGYITYIDEQTAREFRTSLLFNKLLACQNAYICKQLSNEEISELQEKYHLRYIAFNNLQQYGHMVSYFKQAFPLATFLTDTDTGRQSEVRIEGLLTIR